MKKELTTLLYYATRPLVAFLFRFWMSGHKRCQLAPFDLVDATEDSKSDHRIQKLKETVTLIRQHDPKRYEWLRREIRLVVISPYPAPLDAEYHRFAKAVVVKVEAFDQVDVLTLAATLVHEAVHGVLETRGIRYSIVERQRIEKICLRNEIWFLSKVPDGRSIAERKRQVLLSEA